MGYRTYARPFFLLFALSLLFLNPTPSQASRPDIAWMAGGISPVNSVAFSPDGQLLATGSNDSTINLWRVSDGAHIRTLTGHTESVASVAFSPDGQTLASGSLDRTIRFWNVSDGALLRTLFEHSSTVNSVTFSPDGQTLASGSSDKSISLLRVSDGALIRTLSGHTSSVRSVSFSPGGQTLASGSDDRTIRLWSVVDGAHIRTLTGHTSSVNTISFSPDGQTLASGSEDRSIRLWRVLDGGLLRTVTGHTGGASSVAFSPDGQTLASGGGWSGPYERWDNTIRFWRVADGVAIRTIIRQTNDSIPVAFSPDGQVLVAGGRVVDFWIVSEGSLVQSLGHSASVSSLSFSPDGLTLVSGSRDNTIRLLQASDGTYISRLTGHSSGVNSVSFSSDGQTLASGASWADYTNIPIRLWRFSDGAHVRTLTGHTGYVNTVSFSPDGQTLASGSDDNSIRLWRYRDGLHLRSLTGHTSGVNSIAFNTGGQTLASGSWDNTIRLWSVTDGALIRTLTGHTSSVRSVSFSPDGQTLASGSNDSTIRLWNVADGAHIRTLTGHTSTVNSISFSPDGQTLASGGADGKIRLWRIADGVLMEIYDVETGPRVQSVAFSPDGTKLAWGRSDGAVVAANTRATIPQISPTGGVFGYSVNVTVTCPTPGAVIHYTTNGLVPTESDPVVPSGGSIHIDRSLTLKARAFREGQKPSEVAEASFTIVDYISVGSGTSSWEYPFATFFHDARTQSIYLASEIGQAGKITSLALDVTTIPGQVMNSFTIRMKHTGLAQHAQAEWDSEGWATVYQANAPQGSTGWRQFEFQTPFEYNGVDNLLVDFSFNNSFYTSDGYCRYSTPGGNRTLYFRTDSWFGNPLTWAGNTPNPDISNRVPNVRFWFEQPAIPELKTISEAKVVDDQSLVEIQNVPVSAPFENVFYIQSPDRSAGIRVEKVGHGLTAGTMVDIVGPVKTNTNGERFIDATSVTANGTGTVIPLDMAQKTIGGAAAGNPPAGQVGVTGGVGLNNVGLLVKATGKVTAIASDQSWITLWDGSSVQDPDGNPGVRCSTSDILPAGVGVGDMLAITGPVSIVKVEDAVFPVILARSGQDIVQFQGSPE